MDRGVAILIRKIAEDNVCMGIWGTGSPFSDTPPFEINFKLHTSFRSPPSPLESEGVYAQVRNRRSGGP